MAWRLRVPLPTGWTVKISDFQRVPDGGGAYGVLVALTLTGPDGQGCTVSATVPPGQVLQCLGSANPKVCIVLAAWQLVKAYANNFITYSPTTSTVDPIVGTTFAPP